MIEPFEEDANDAVAESSGRLLNQTIWGFVGIGILLRLIAFWQDFPLWWDEAFLAVNLLRRDYLALAKPLDYGQVCPLFFLWVELLFVKLFGFNEWSLRLFPWLCSIVSIVLFRAMAVRFLEARAALLAVAIFAVSVHPIRHSADVKPYSADLLMALAVQAIALEWSRRPERARWLWSLTIFSPIALLFSHPSVFVLGGMGLALAWKVWKTQNRSVILAWFSFGVLSATFFAALYVLFTRDQASSASPGMKEMWIRSFPPLDDFSNFLRWVFVAHSGDMLAYPCGGERGASSLSLFLCVIGAIALVRRRSGTITAILLAPLALAMVAAAARLYPYGGPAPHGSAARIMQYSAPALCLLIGLGASQVLGVIRIPRLRDRLLRLGCLGLVIVGFVPLISGFRHPYRAYQAEASREFSRRFWPEVGRGAEVADLRWDFSVADWDSIHLGVAVSLCNEAIDLPGRLAKRPQLDKVTFDHPLRCVLGVEPEKDSPRLLAWLESMRQTYDLRNRETFRVPISEPGRKAEFERYDVFEFVPRVEMQSRLPDQSVKGR